MPKAAPPSHPAGTGKPTPGLADDPAARLLPGATVLTRCRSQYCTSFAIDELTVRFDDGSVRSMLHKDLSPGALIPEARGSRPAEVGIPVREVAVYRNVLADAGLATATCYGAEADAGTGRYSLALEKVDGVELWQVGELERWRQAAAGLATIHRRLAPFATTPGVPFLRCDEAWFDIWPRRARRLALGGTPGRRRRLAAVLAATRPSSTGCWTARRR